MILEDDKPKTPEPESTAGRSKSTEPPGHGPWWDIEDRCLVNDDLEPIPLLEQDGLASTPTLAQGQPHPHQYPPGSSRDQIKQHGDDGTTEGVLDKPTLYSQLTPLDRNNGGGGNENVSEFDTDMLLAFKEQERSLSAVTPNSPHPYHSSTELLYP